MNDNRSQLSIMNSIVNDKKGHNIVNDKQLLIMQTAYFLHDQLVYKNQVIRFCLFVCLFGRIRLSFKICRLTLNEVGRGELVLIKKS